MSPPRAAEVNVGGRHRRARCDGRAVADAAPDFTHAVAIRDRALERFGVERLRVRRESLVDPKVLPIAARHEIRPPLVRHLMVMQEVEALVGAPWVALVIRTVRDDRLVLHAKVRGLHDAVLVTAERVRAERLFEPARLTDDVLEQDLAFLQVLGEHPVGDRELVACDALHFARDLFVGRDVQCDAVRIDRRVDAPIERAPSLVHRRIDELSVARTDQSVGNGDVQVHRLWLVVGLVFARPPKIGSLHLATRRNPRRARGGRLPLEATIPRRPRCHPGTSAVLDEQGEFSSGLDLGRVERSGGR